MNNTNIYVDLVYFQHTSITRKERKKERKKNSRGEQ